MYRTVAPGTLFVSAVVACAGAPSTPSPRAPVSSLAPVPEMPSAPVELRAGEARWLQGVRQLTSIGRNGDARFSLQGDRLLFQSRRDDSPDECLLSIGVDGRGERFLPGAPCRATGVVAIPEGYAYSVRSPTGDRAARGPWRLTLQRGSLRDEVPRSREYAFEDARDAALAVDSNELFFSALVDGQRDIFVFHLESAQIERLTANPAPEGSPAPAPDGRRVAFWRRTSSSASEIFLLDRDRALAVQLTALGSVGWAPTMHPSGKFVVFGSGFYGDRDHDLLLVHVDTRLVERVTDYPGYDGLPSFAPDGATLAWTSCRQGGAPQLFIAEFLD